jgi:heptosyltransferase-1
MDPPTRKARLLSHEQSRPRRAGTRERILLVRLSHLGDVVHALPVFHALRQVAPEAELAWAIQGEFADLVRPLPGLARVIPFARQGGLGAWWSLRRELADFAADWAVDGQGNLKSAAVVLASAARRRTGHHRRDWREPFGAMVLNDSAEAIAQSAGQHAVDRALHLARHVAGRDLALAPTDWLALTEREREAGRRAFESRLPDADSAAVIVQLAGAGDVRAWPLEHQRALLIELAREKRDVLALSGPAEVEVGRHLAREVPAASHWVGQRGLRELAAFFSAAAERGAQLVASDSGPMHLAAASGLSVVALAGPQDPSLTGPWPVAGRQSPHASVHAPDAPECAPCRARACYLESGPVCMSRITVEAVLDALEPVAQGASTTLLPQKS